MRICVLPLDQLAEVLSKKDMPPTIVIAAAHDGKTLAVVRVNGETATVPLSAFRPSGHPELRRPTLTVSNSMTTGTRSGSVSTRPRPTRSGTGIFLAPDSGCTRTMSRRLGNSDTKCVWGIK